MNSINRINPDFDVIAIGELNADLILRGDVVPQFGQVEKLIDDAALVLGSSTAIFACGAARLGLRVAFIGKVGDDALGQFVLRELNTRGVDTSGVVVAPGIKTGMTVILNRGADRAMLTYLGCINALRFDEINQSFQTLLHRARHVHLGSYYLLDGLRPDVPRLFDLAHETGLTVSLDTNYDPTEKWDGNVLEAIQRTDVFLPNEAELLGITHEASAEHAARKLSTDNRIIAAKLGSAGAMAVQGATTLTAPSIKMDVVDTVGAGDSFDAGFVYGFLNGWPTQKSLQMGCVCGSLSTRAAGGTAAQATVDEALSRIFL